MAMHAASLVKEIGPWCWQQSITSSNRGCGSSRQGLWSCTRRIGRCNCTQARTTARQAREWRKHASFLCYTLPFHQIG